METIIREIKPIGSFIEFYSYGYVKSALKADDITRAELKELYEYHRLIKDNATYSEDDPIVVKGKVIALKVQHHALRTDRDMLIHNIKEMIMNHFKLPLHMLNVRFHKTKDTVSFESDLDGIPYEGEFEIVDNNIELRYKVLP